MEPNFSVFREKRYFCEHDDTHPPAGLRQPPRHGPTRGVRPGRSSGVGAAKAADETAGCGDTGAALEAHTNAS
ncbi:MAG TPA: hypothetical protein DCW71_04730 [Alistipes sp.]|nr:hypothetical protein [Alistipes sp.]